MGSSLSSTVGDRRNGALRRSQRKSITGACSNIDKVLKAIKKFRGTEDSEEYKNLKVRILQIEKNLQFKVKDLQPQFKTINDITEQKIKSAHLLLDRKAQENKEIAESEGVTSNGASVIEPELSISKDSEPETEYPSSPTQPNKTENKKNSILLRMSKLTLPKWKSENTSFSESEGTEVVAEVHKSPEATRRSIMKYGIPVLPSPTSDGVPRLVSFNTPDDFETILKKHEKRLKFIKQDVANIEIRISEFVGKKNGKHYNNLKKALTQLVEELEGIEEEELLDQVVLCHNYIKSCYDFLDSKAVDSGAIDDDSFSNYTDSRIYGSTHDLLEGHSVRTTAI